MRSTTQVKKLNVEQYHSKTISQATKIMKKLSVLLLATALVTTSCESYEQFWGTATGAGIGGMFGSAIGGIMGGPRGSDAGAVIGMVTGAVVGAAATSPEAMEETAQRPSRKGDVRYEEDFAYTTPTSLYDYIEVQNVSYSDKNNNHKIDAGEVAYITMEIYNRSGETMYDIAPQITCDNKRVLVSPTAIVSQLDSGKGVKYKAMVKGADNLKNGTAKFTVAFGSGNTKTVAKTFTLSTAN